MKFDLMIVYDTCNITHKNISFYNCNSIKDVRHWFNEAGNFIDIDEQIHNMRNVLYIDIKEVQLKGL